jgi:hypothetical protein
MVWMAREIGTPATMIARSVMILPVSVASSCLCYASSRTTERSMALSANRWAYSLKPIDASHSAMPFMALPVDGVLHHFDRESQREA